MPKIVFTYRSRVSCHAMPYLTSCAACVIERWSAKFYFSGSSVFLPLWLRSVPVTSSGTHRKEKTDFWHVLLLCYMCHAISHVMCYICHRKMKYQVLLPPSGSSALLLLLSAAVPQIVRQQAPHAQNNHVTCHGSCVTRVKEARIPRSLWQPLASEVLQLVCPFE